MELVGKEFTEQVLYYKNAWLPAHGIVLKALQERTKVHAPSAVPNRSPRLQIVKL